MRMGLLRNSRTCFGRMDCVQIRRRKRPERERAVWRQPLHKMEARSDEAACSLPRSFVLYFLYSSASPVHRVQYLTSFFSISGLPISLQQRCISISSSPPAKLPANLLYSKAISILMPKQFLRFCLSIQPCHKPLDALDRLLQILQRIRIGNTQIALAAVSKRGARHKRQLLFL